jgi:transcriptional regulator with PAS, ATPase and Fis domain
VIDGTFDDRLFYRLNVIHLVIPARRTPEDTQVFRTFSTRT